MRRSKLLKASRFGDFLRSTMSWWRSAMISASREVRDLKSPMTTHKISFSISPMRRSIARFAALRQWDKVYDKDKDQADTCGVGKVRPGDSPHLAAIVQGISTPERPRLFGVLVGSGGFDYGSANGRGWPIKASASPIARATANRRRISRPSFGWQAENQTGQRRFTPSWKYRRSTKRTVGAAACPPKMTPTHGFCGRRRAARQGAQIHWQHLRFGANWLCLPAKQ